MSATVTSTTPAGLLPSEDERALRETVRSIASGFGPRYFREASDRGSETELWNALGERGYLGAHLPAEHGGGGLGMLELAAVIEETSAAGCPMLAALYSPGVIGAILAAHGTDEQKRRWLPGLAGGELRASFAITEPDAGSNSHRIATIARRTDAGYAISGNKQFISGVEDAGLLLVVARTGVDERTGRGLLSVFALDPDAPGLTRTRMPTALQMPEAQWELRFEDVEVGPESIVGAEGDGLRAAFSGMNVERILTAAICTGIGLYALGKAVAYAKERVVWDVPIGAHQAVAHPLAESKIELESARLLTRRACALHDSGADAAEASNMAKLAGADAGTTALDRAIQSHGGSGVAVESELANYWFIVRTLKIGPVSREMILNYVAERSLGLPRSY